MPLISVVLTTFNEMPHKLPVAVHSILDQTFQDFEFLIYHDGRNSQSFTDTSNFVNGLDQIETLTFFALQEQRGLTGYPMRQDSLQYVGGDYIVFSNGDNYHTRDYLQYFAREVIADPNIDFVYVNGLHDYAGAPWTVLDSRPGMGAIDMAFFMTRTSLMKEIGFTDFSRGGDGTLVDTLASRGVKMKKVPNGAVTVVHG